MRELTAVIIGPVAETIARPGHSLSTTLSRSCANFLHQICIAGFAEYLTHWMHLRANDISAKSFCPQKTNDTVSYRMFINDVTVTSS